jgi:protein-S-isoprenylcysteine O-methyltransferase Ste14
MFVNNRIFISRLFALVFLLLFIFTEPKLEDSAWEAILFFAGLILVGIATVGRLWCSLYISGRKSAELVVEGPYSICRHPLYLFSLLGVTGLGLASEVVCFAALLFLVLFLLTGG